MSPLFEKINNIENQRPIVILSPLDWGLGHASRCIPIIKILLEFGCEVIVATAGDQKAILSAEFTDLRFVELPGYNVVYRKRGLLTFIGLLLQIPKILRAIKKENLWLNKYLLAQNVDIVISDNRYGFYTHKVHSIFLTHQLQIKTSLGRLADRFLQNVNYRFLKNFDECWIPDYEGASNFAGELSHPHKMPRIPVKYLGPLSRFESSKQNSTNGSLLIILSGPEPARSEFEELLFKQIVHYKNSVVLLRALPGCNEIPISNNENLKIYNHVNSKGFQQLINSSEYIISRSGYSTIMDLLPLRKKCIFVATPGQPEQQYLAEYLFSKKYCLVFSQSGFSLEDAVHQAKFFDFNFPSFGDRREYKTVITEVVNRFK